MRQHVGAQRRVGRQRCPVLQDGALPHLFGLLPGQVGVGRRQGQRLAVARAQHPERRAQRCRVGGVFLVQADAVRGLHAEPGRGQGRLLFPDRLPQRAAPAMVLDPADGAVDELGRARLDLGEVGARAFCAETLAPGEEGAGLLGRERLATQLRRRRVQRLDRQAVVRRAAAGRAALEQRPRRCRTALQGIRGLQEGVRRVPVRRGLRQAHQVAQGLEARVVARQQLRRAPCRAGILRLARFLQHAHRIEEGLGRGGRAGRRGLRWRAVRLVGGLLLADGVVEGCGRDRRARRSIRRAERRGVEPRFVFQAGEHAQRRRRVVAAGVGQGFGHQRGPGVPEVLADGVRRRRQCFQPGRQAHHRAGVAGGGKLLGEQLTILPSRLRNRHGLARARFSACRRVRVVGAAHPLQPLLGPLHQGRGGGLRTGRARLLAGRGGLERGGLGQGGRGVGLQRVDRLACVFAPTEHGGELRLARLGQHARLEPAQGTALAWGSANKRRCSPTAHGLGTGRGALRGGGDAPNAGEIGHDLQREPRFRWCWPNVTRISRVGSESEVMRPEPKRRLNVSGRRAFGGQGHAPCRCPPRSTRTSGCADPAGRRPRWCRTAAAWWTGPCFPGG